MTHPYRSALMFACLFFSACGPALAQSASRMRIESGAVAGDVGANGVRVFKGIPYAAAPVGALRWRAPQAPASWTAPLQAHDYGPSCPQGAAPRFVPHSSRGATRSED